MFSPYWIGWIFTELCDQCRTELTNRLDERQRDETKIIVHMFLHNNHRWWKFYYARILWFWSESPAQFSSNIVCVCVSFGWMCATIRHSRYITITLKPFTVTLSCQRFVMCPCMNRRERTISYVSVYSGYIHECDSHRNYQQQPQEQHWNDAFLRVPMAL